jgi:hypothetical protein
MIEEVRLDVKSIYYVFLLLSWSPYTSFGAEWQTAQRYSRGSILVFRPNGRIDPKKFQAQLRTRILSFF